MQYIIDYSVLCEKGKVRVKNQDNFWCTGSYLESENCGLEIPLAGSSSSINSPVFAVFDGMGGERHGEIAAYIAAIAFNSQVHLIQKSELKQFLSRICDKMNSEICSYKESNHTGHMGTTTAILVMGKKEVYVCNVGDSKIFQYSAGKLSQITHDHIVAVSSEKKPALTQHLGIPKTDFVIEPYIAKGEYNEGDRYLICSDGLTDMVTPNEIEKALSSIKDVSECANSLMNGALENGGIDNITIILCDIHKKQGFRLNILGKDGL